MLNYSKPMLALMLAAAGFLIVGNSACVDSKSNTDSSTVCIPLPNDTSALSKIDHYIPKDEIRTMRAAFDADSLNQKNPELFITESEGFNKKALLDLLNNKDCVGIRIYYGIAKEKTGKKALKMIIVGTNSQGKDLYTTHTTNKLAAQAGGSGDYGLEYGQCCQGQPNNQ
ncbi:MAG: hypothetical protein KGO82_13205 [Bacteroidota bacterium]|nr:hypothetical protein [Bacteroidota bacterium]